MKKKRYPTYRKKRKRKRQPVKNMITAVVLCITIALCNGWVPPHTLEDAKKQGELFGTVFLTYIEENAKNFSENISETISDTVRETLNQKGKQTEEQEK